MNSSLPLLSDNPGRPLVSRVLVGELDINHCRGLSFFEGEKENRLHHWKMQETC